jgi:hypothetical protein
MKQDRRSAFVDFVMPNATEAERIDATRRWFNVLTILIRFAENHRCPVCDSRESDGNARVA